MITVQNDRIRVTVPQNIWDSFAIRADRLAHTQVLPSGELRTHSAEEIQRGLILSEAMSKLGNASELKFLAQEEPESTEIIQHAKLILIRNYLLKHGRYDADEVITRYQDGLRMSQGMQQEVSEAESYAQGQLSPLSIDEARTELINYVRECIASGIKPTEAALRFKGKLTVLKTGGLRDESLAALAEASELLSLLYEIQLRYRKVRANMAGWEIDVLGDMPDQIGLCRYAEDISA